MRIISGSARGMRLKSPPGKKIRPTSAKVRAAFFNIAQESIQGALFLDLFSGSGGLGLEALSRGAEKCIFIDEDRDAVKIIQENIKLAKMQERASVYRGDARRLLPNLSKNEEYFDIIYIDPPYRYDKISEILFLLWEGRLLEEGGIIGVERPSYDDGSWGFSPFMLQRKKVYGDTALYILGSRQ